MTDRFVLIDGGVADRSSDLFEQIRCPNCQRKGLEGPAFGIEARRFWRDKKNGRVLRDHPVIICSACHAPLGVGRF